MTTITYVTFLLSALGIALLPTTLYYRKKAEKRLPGKKYRKISRFGKYSLYGIFFLIAFLQIVSLG